MDQMTIDDFVMKNKEILLNDNPGQLIEYFLSVGIKLARDILKITDDKIINGMPIEGGTPGRVAKIYFYKPDIEKLQVKYNDQKKLTEQGGGGKRRKKYSKKKKKSKKKKGKSKRKSKTRRRR